MVSMITSALKPAVTRLINPVARLALRAGLTPNVVTVLSVVLAFAAVPLYDLFCRVTGFEPQSDALAALLACKSELERYLPHSIGDGGTHVLRICAGSGMTSLFEPDAAALALFPELAPYAVVRERVPVATRRLDDIAEITQMDCLKIDIQGGELDVFRHGREQLSRAVAIQTEVSFVTLYEGQPSFGEVDCELRSQGFMPHRFDAVKHWPIAPFAWPEQPRRALHQLLEADVVYIRDLARPDLISSEQYTHLALIAHNCYASHDLAMHCLAALERRHVLWSGAAEHYRQAVLNTVAAG